MIFKICKQCKKEYWSSAGGAKCSTCTSKGGCLPILVIIIAVLFLARSFI